MNKPLTMIVKETKTKLINICNESGLPPVILDLIVQGVYSDIHSLTEKQTLEEEMAYMKTIEEKVKEIEIETTIEDQKEGLAKS